MRCLYSLGFSYLFSTIGRKSPLRAFVMEGKLIRAKEERLCVSAIDPGFFSACRTTPGPQECDA